MLAMFAPKLFLATILLVNVNCRYVVREDLQDPRLYIDDSGTYILQEDLEDALSEQQYESVHEGHLQHRARRQALGSYMLNQDMTSSANVKVPIASNGRNMLSALGGVGLNDKHRQNSASAGLALNQRFSMGTSLGESYTDFLERTRPSAMGKLNLMCSPPSSFDCKAGMTKYMSPSTPNSSWHPKLGLSFTKQFGHMNR